MTASGPPVLGLALAVVRGSWHPRARVQPSTPLRANGNFEPGATLTKRTLNFFA